MTLRRIMPLACASLLAGVVLLASVLLIGNGESRDAAEEGEEVTAGRIKGPDTESRFGFLAFPEEDGRRVRSTGARWVRPHPGPFIWGRMQTSAGAPIRFQEADRMVRSAQGQKLSLLVTLWPYAKWDQRAYKRSKGCRIRDEFRHELGEFRCVPRSRGKYRRWVQAVVERYDGDGRSDMKGLRTAVKFWEASNEPDLRGPGLQFFVGSAREYVNLLADTYRAARSADKKAKVLIAGAAGGQEEFIDFWRSVLSHKRARSSFDIGNVHCISGGDYGSLNVAPYKNLLQEKGIKKQIWVTEAETFVSEDPALNATQLLLSSREALNLGAKRIFYTSLNFKTPPGGKPPPVEDAPNITPDPSIPVNDPIATYRKIIESLGR